MMHTLPSDHCQQVQGGNLNLVIPATCTLAIGATGAILSWVLKKAYEGDTDSFSNWQNFAIEGFTGAAIAAVATASFVMAAA